MKTLAKLLGALLLLAMVAAGQFYAILSPLMRASDNPILTYNVSMPILVSFVWEGRTGSRSYNETAATAIRNSLEPLTNETTVLDGENFLSVTWSDTDGKPKNVTYVDETQVARMMGKLQLLQD